MSEFTYNARASGFDTLDERTTERVLAGVKRMVERMRVLECPKDPDLAREHRLTMSTVVNALCRGEWQR